MTTSSRRVKSLIARPRISSLLPREYRLAVSKKLNAAFESPLDEWPALRLVDAPGMIAAIGDAVAHAAEADPRYLQTRATELHILHYPSPLSMPPARKLQPSR